jgi:heptosyltransferase-1
MAVRILVVRLGSLGDIVHALPAVALLRPCLPLATIGWVVEERWSPLLVAAGAAPAGLRGPQRPLVDAVHVVNTVVWRRALLSDGTWAEVRNALRDLRGANYEIAIDFQGAWKSALLAQWSGAASRVGFAQPREKPATMFYTEQVQPGGRHVVEQNLALAASVIRRFSASVEGKQIPRFARNDKTPRGPLLPVDAAAERTAEGELRKRGLEQFAILNPGAGWGAKQWPAERYAEVARALAQKGLPSVINYGPGEEPLAREVERASMGSALPIPATLGELIAFTRRARLLVGGDTGPTHLAALLGVPVVAVYGPTDPARTGPYAANRIVLRSADSVTTTSHRGEPEQGLLTITADEVIAAAERLLAVGNPQAEDPGRTHPGHTEAGR